jgi:hypothetical protein
MTDADIMQLASAEADKIERIFPGTDKKALELAFHAGRVSVVEEMTAAFQTTDYIEKAKVQS